MTSNYYHQKFLKLFDIAFLNLILNRKTYYVNQFPYLMAEISQAHIGVSS